MLTRLVGERLPEEGYDGFPGAPRVAKIYFVLAEEAGSQAAIGG